MKTRKRSYQEEVPSDIQSNTTIIDTQPLCNSDDYPINSTPTTNSDDSINQKSSSFVDDLLQEHGITETMTKGGWCLRKGLEHVVSVENGILRPLVAQHGPPPFYHQERKCRHEATDNLKAPQTCFESLCRTIAGQQLAGKAAQSIWKKLLTTTNNSLTPKVVIQLASNDALENNLQKPAGLSRAKANSILDLAHHFDRGDLSEDFLTTSPKVREALLQVKGLGPWSCDMFVMFYLEHANVFPVGDLGVRKGVARFFRLRGSGKNASLCPKKRSCQNSATRHSL